MLLPPRDLVREKRIRMLALGDASAHSHGGAVEGVSIAMAHLLGQVKDVQCGGMHSGALTKDGALWMWGSNEFGINYYRYYHSKNFFFLISNYIVCK